MEIDAGDDDEEGNGAGPLKERGVVEASICPREW